MHQLPEGVIPVLLLVGILDILRRTFGILHFCWIHFFVRNDLSMYGANRSKTYEDGKQSKRKRSEAFAIVTGASAGIGRALAWEIASRGMNLIIVARTTSALEELKIEIQKKFPGTQVEICVLDCYNIQEATTALQAKCREFGVTMLINNVGCESGEPEPLAEKSRTNLQNIIDLNITFNAQLTRVCLAPLIENCQALSCRGIVISLASQAALLENPLISSYSAAKAFNTSFSRALAGEMRHHHNSLVDICNLRPAFVESAMSGLKAEGIKGLLLGVVKPDYFACVAVNKFGHLDDVSPVMLHDLTGKFLTSLPKFLKEWFLYKLSSRRYSLRKAGIKDD